MSDKGEYIYIMYPIPIEEARRLSLPPFSPPHAFTMEEDESFMPLWFGNARFPEDDIDD